MAITLRSSSTRQTGTIAGASGTIVANLPPTWSEGDIVIIQAACLKNGINAAITGWTQLYNTIINQDAYALYWRRMVAGDTGPSITFAGSFGNNQYSIRSYAWSNVSKTANPFTSPVFNTGAASVVFPSTTSDYDDQVDLATVIGNRGNGTWTLPASLTVLDTASLLDGNGFFYAYGFGYAPLATAGTTLAPGTATNNSGFGQASRAYAIRMYGEPTTPDRRGAPISLASPVDAFTATGDNSKPTYRLTSTESSDSFSADFYNTTLQAVPTWIGQGALSAQASTAAAAVRTSTPALNASTINGDLVVAHVMTVGADVEPTPSLSTWTQFGPVVKSGSGTLFISYRMYWRYYDGQANGTFSATMPAGANTSAISSYTQTFRGPNSSTPFENFNSTTYTGFTSTSIAGVPITTTRRNSMLMQGYVHTAQTTSTPPTGWTERSDLTNAAPSSGTVGHGIIFNVSSATNPSTVTAPNDTLSDATSKSVIAFSYAISSTAVASDFYQYLSGTETPDTTQITLAQDLSGVVTPFQITATENRDTYQGSTTTGQAFTFQATEPSDTYTGTHNAIPNSNMQLSATESNDAFAGSVSAVTTVNLTKTESNDTFSGSVSAVTTTNLTATENRDTFVGAFSINSNTNLTVTEANDTFAGSVSSSTDVVFTPTEPYDQWTGDAHVATTSANLTATEQPDQFYTLLSTRVEMTVQATEARDAYAGSVNAYTTIVLGNSNETGQDTYLGTTSVNTPFNLTASESNDSFAGSVQAVTTARLAATETGTDSFSGSLSAVTTARLSASESNDTFSGSAAITGTVTVTATEPNDTTQFTFDNRTVMIFQITEPNDTFVASAEVRGNFALTATEASDGFLGSIQATTPFRVQATEANDNYAGSIAASTPFTISAAEANDNFAGSIAATTPFRVQAIEANDTYQGSHSLTANVLLGATEAKDTFAGNVISITTIRAMATEASDSMDADFDIISTLSVGATEGTDSFQGQVKVVSTIVLGGVERSDVYRGRMRNNEFQKNIFVNKNDNWALVDPVLVNVDGHWVEPTSGYIRTADGSWHKIYAKH